MLAAMRPSSARAPSQKTCADSRLMARTYPSCTPHLMARTCPSCASCLVAHTKRCSTCACLNCVCVLTPSPAPPVPA